MKRNIKLAYYLTFCWNSLFWLGIWLLYYLKFTDYQGIGLIETTWIIISIISEIPTGAIADIFGKKYTLTFAFLLQAIGQTIMGIALNYSYLIISVVIMTLGSALFSGSYEALVYDSLKQDHKEKKYEKILANIQTISLVAWAICSIIGGFLYTLRPGLPFIVTGAFFFLGLIGTLFITEPNIDTQKFSFTTYINQTKQGFRQLFSQTFKKRIISLLIITSILVIPYEFLGDSLIIDFGYQPKELGFFYSLLFIISASAVQLAPKIKKRFTAIKAFYLLNLAYASLMSILIFLSKYLGGLALFGTAAIHHINKNITSDIVNQSTKSKYRATTLSTFNLLTIIPFALTAIFIGKFIDQFSARLFATYFGLSLFAITLYLLKNSSKPPLDNI
jgi:MFS family permease